VGDLRWYGKRTEVVVEYLLPTDGTHPNYWHKERMSEFWSTLVEKAYAKLQYCYEGLSLQGCAIFIPDGSSGQGEIKMQHELYMGHATVSQDFNSFSCRVDG